VLRGFVLACVESELEKLSEPLSGLGSLCAEIDSWLQPRRNEHLHRVVASTPAVAAQVALFLVERPQALHLGRTVGEEPDVTGYAPSMAETPRILTFDISVDRDRSAHSALGGPAIPVDDAWWAEHIVLAGLARCTLTSLDYHAHRASLASTGSATAHGIVTKRESDGRYAFVEVDVQLDVELEPAPDGEAVLELVAKAERDCFVGASLTTKPRYTWTVNGEAIS